MLRSSGEGIMISVDGVNPSSALSSIEVIDDGIVSFLSDEHPVNELFLIFVTVVSSSMVSTLLYSVNLLSVSLIPLIKIVMLIFVLADSFDLR